MLRELRTANRELAASGDLRGRRVPRASVRSSQFVVRSLWTLVPCALSLASLWPGSASGQATTNVPVQDLMYRHVDRLVAEGLVDTVHVGQRPYTRREMARIVAAAERNLSRVEEKASDTTLTDGARGAFARRAARVRAILGVLRAEYGTDGRAGTLLLESGTLDWTWTNSPPRAVPFDELGGISAVTNPLVDYRLGRQYVDGGNLALETTHRVRLLPVLVGAARLRGWNGWGNGVTGDDTELTVETLYGQLALRNLLIEVGRDHLFYGQGMRASLSVSGNAPALDMVKVASDLPFHLPGFLRALGPVRASIFLADLGDEQNFPGAKLVGYKMSFAPSARAEVGVSVVDQMGGRGAPSASFGERLLDLIPIIDPLVFGERDLQFSNKLAGMDFRFRFPHSRGLELYVDGMLDDFDHRRIRSSFWDDAGWITGVSIPRLRRDGRLQLAAELQRTGLRYSQHTQFTSGLTLDGRIIGNALGSKASAGYARLTWDWGATSSVSLDGAYERRSSDRYRVHVDDAEEQGWRFVLVERQPRETRARMSVSLAGDLSRTRSRWLAELGYERVGNFAFESGQRRNNVLVRVGVERRL